MHQNSKHLLMSQYTTVTDILLYKYSGRQKWLLRNKENPLTNTRDSVEKDKTEVYIYIHYLLHSAQHI